MTRRRRNWLIAITLLLTTGFVGLVVTARILAGRFEPYIREQTIQYLKKRFDSEVEVTALRISMPKMSAVKLVLERGHGTIARVEGEGLVLRHKGRTDVPPMFIAKSFSFDVDLGSLFTPAKDVPEVMVDGMEINVPAKGDRPDLQSGQNDSVSATGVRIDEVLITNSILRILPKDEDKTPLRFDLHRVKLGAVTAGDAMQYTAELTNPKPPGEIFSKGTFGPWVAGEPGDTPMTGDYDFENADLGVFSGIAGILRSIGSFDGTLSKINARGEASVPNFRLTSAGNPLPLSTTFEVLIDGTNGNTILKPVNGILGTTKFTTSGGVLKHEADTNRAISLEVEMPNGSMRDVLTLGMKGKPFMEGRIFVKARIDIPPLTGPVREKLVLDGRFEITHGKFLRSSIQDQIDTLSRRGQGQPQNQEIDQVLSGMAGVFKLNNEIISFKSLSFAVPGAGVDLVGNYDLEKDKADFHGTLKLQAKVSETMTGWKRWVLKPVDPFFSKDGSGTLVHIQVVGSSGNVQWGRDRGSVSKK